MRLLEIVLWVLYRLITILDFLGKGFGKGDQPLPSDPPVDATPKKPTTPLRPVPDDLIDGRPSQPIPPVDGTGPDDDGSLHPSIVELLRLHNDARAEAGARPLVLDPVARDIAVAQAKYMSGIAQLTHGRPNGGSLAKDFHNRGIRFTLVAENVAVGYTSGKSVHQGWMESRGHRANILRPGLSRVGFAAVNLPGKQTYWAAVFYSV